MRSTPRPKVETLHSNEQRITPLCDPADIGVSDFLDHEPKPRVWILDDLLPLGVVGLLAAGGGTGKSFLTLQLAISVATGIPFLGIEVTDPGAVLLICAEDERDELHRRVWRIIQLMREGLGFTESDDELLRERLFIASRVGEDNLMTQVIEGIAERRSIGEQIRLTAEQIPALKLIGLDPIVRFRGGDENNNDHATRFVEAVETLRAATGATIWLAHHMNKEGLRVGAERLSAESLRGASALFDGVRWAAAMGTLSKDVAEDYGIDPEEANRYVRLDTVKNNYGPPWDGLWLKRGPGGVLVPTMLLSNRKRRDEQKAEDRYRAVLPKLKGLVRQYEDKGESLTKRRLRDFAGKAGLFGVGDQTLRAIVERAIAEGELKTKPNGRSVELRTW